MAAPARLDEDAMAGLHAAGVVGGEEQRADLGLRHGRRIFLEWREFSR
jgi:hypothetical protein